MWVSVSFRSSLISYGEMDLYSDGSLRDKSFRLLSEFSHFLFVSLTSIIITSFTNCFRLLSEFSHFLCIICRLYAKTHSIVSVSFRSSLISYLRYIMYFYYIFYQVSVSFRSSLISYSGKYETKDVQYLVGFRLLSEFSHFL